MIAHTQIPVFVLMPSAMLLITYFMIGFNYSGVTYFSFWLTLILVSLASVSYGYMISALSSNYETASSLSTPLLIPFMIFGGFFIRSLNVPIYFQWISYISWFRYGLDAMAGAQFRHLQLTCNSKGGFICGNRTTIDGSLAIQMLGISDFGIFINSIALISLNVGFRMLGLIALVVKTKIDER
ncbi:Protein white [Thelohanellus kitauei]|uniref:Protein white n=1 Tax=Thelohanellus kitauei TaxID=669202 RepID=A0A0C2MVE5_THEKT|nr:Protein white [Thelohanellus kitauei]